MKVKNAFITKAVDDSAGYSRRKSLISRKGTTSSTFFFYTKNNTFPFETFFIPDQMYKMELKKREKKNYIMENTIKKKGSDSNDEI